MRKMRLFLMLTKQSEASEPHLSVPMAGRGATGTISLIWTPVLMFWLDLLRASFLLPSWLMGLLRPVMLWCVGWAIPGKAKGKTGQERGQRTVDPQVGGWGILASPQWPGKAWEDLWKRYYSKERAKLFPEVPSQWTRASGHKLQQKEFLAVYVKNKNWCEFFEVLKQGPREVWLCILGAFKIWLQKTFSSLILLWS